MKNHLMHPDEFVDDAYPVLSRKEAQTAAIDFVRRLAGYWDQEPSVWASQIILYRDGLAPGADGDDDETTNEEFLQEVAKALGGPIHE